MSHQVRKDCRLCNAGDLETVLELTPTPPANELLTVDARGQQRFPLYLARCRDCGHVQLPVVVDPERLFRSYVYVSGTSPVFVDHFRRYAEESIRFLDLQEGDLVVEIGSNDGTMLQAFKDRGMRVLGVDPAREIAQRATDSGIPTWPEFFTRDTAARIRWEHGEAALVVANNVFAHADDLRQIAYGVRDLMSPSRGCFSFEVQYLVDMVKKTLFDMVYHEHLSYHSLAPLARFIDSVGMSLVDAQRVETHGGSIRCRVAPSKGMPKNDRLRALLDAEVQALALSVDPFGSMGRRIQAASDEVNSFFARAASKKWTVAGYGAPAKLTTMVHRFDLDQQDIAYVVDDSPWKHGMYCPGTAIPIFSPEKMDREPPDAVFVFAWNFAEPIIRKLRERGFGKTIVVPLPEYREIRP